LSPYEELECGLPPPLITEPSVRLPIMSTSRTVIILKGPNDWKAWIETIKATSLSGEIWEFVNPDLPAEEVKSLVEPVRPSLAAVRAENQPEDEAVLSQADYIKLRFSELQSAYSYDRRLYDTRYEAIKDLRIKILETIRIEFHLYTYDCTIVYDMLVRLKQRFQPSDRVQIQELITKWASLRTYKKTMNMEDWLMA